MPAPQRALNPWCDNCQENNNNNNLKKKTPQTQKTEETEECSLFVTEAVRQTSEKLSLFYLDSHDFVICAFFVFLSFMSNFDTSCKLTDVLML